MTRGPAAAATAYAEALQWLYARTRSGGRRTSARAATLLRELSLKPPTPTAVVVGTNGKGTVSTMLARGLSASGARTGRFLSPHVEEFRERVAVDGVPVSEAALVAFVERARRLDDAWPHDEGLRPAFFEWTLAFALERFAASADACVLEAGVGGLHDATRAVRPVDVVVLTNVDLDHMDTLGTTLTAIASDKAGAFRAGVPVVCGASQPEVVAVAAAQAARLGAPFHLDPFVSDTSRNAGAASDGLFELPRAVADDLAAPPTGAPSGALAGANANRRANSRLAAAALRLLAVPEPAVAAGLRAPALPARFERFLVQDDRGGELLVVLDGAHDPAAAARLAAEVTPGYTLLFGALARKQGQRVLDTLAPRAATVIVTEAARGEPPTAVWPGATVVADTAAALDAATAAARAAGAPLLLVAGSLYLAGLVRPLLTQRGARLPDPWEQLAVTSR
ncbi:MAG: bifunctional folylpolyglutamate synthase/dihydrofolate synthase [Trueperaceae bacterium]|nr:bifunctional folylpolyglutamate synthase/dihydrofolate synthase [Trueperaceae bacterium]